MRHQSFGAMMLSLGDEVATGMIENALNPTWLWTTKPHEAAAAARKAYVAVSGIPVVGPLLAPRQRRRPLPSDGL